MKDLEQLTQALAKGADDAATTAHLILKSLQEPVQPNHCKQYTRQCLCNCFRHYIIIINHKHMSKTCSTVKQCAQFSFVFVLVGLIQQNNSVLKVLLIWSVLLPSDNIDVQLSTKASRNTWETSVATDIMTPKLKVTSLLLLTFSIKLWID